ncbi:hypothetical protein [Streptomyces sp. NPDC026659]|uniref:hypothetical protein n=1 Tax=Streptomyces sp. NPDC026659 TaxID=3155123 RepID=UPI0033C6D5D0
MSNAQDVSWEFFHSGRFWNPSRRPPTDENLLLAVETLVTSFGRRAWAVQLFLDALAETDGGAPSRRSVNTTTAYVERIDPKTVEIRDKYGQFQNIAMPVAEFREMLSVLMDSMRRLFPEPNTDQSDQR